MTDAVLHNDGDPRYDERRATSARSEMNNQRVLNLERMDEQQAHRFFNELASNVGAQSESIRIRAAPRGLRHGDAPVWGAHPGSREDAGVPGGLPRPTRNAGRVILKDGLWVAEGVKDYGGGQVFHVVAIVELHDGEM
jgi:hypothetical protein